MKLDIIIDHKCSYVEKDKGPKAHLWCEYIQLGTHSWPLTDICIVKEVTMLATITQAFVLWWMDDIIKHV